jgi:hypothetical protein
MYSEMVKIDKYEFIEIIIPAGSTGTRFFCNDQPNLRFVSQMALSIYPKASVPKSILSGNGNIDDADFLQGFLVLYYSDKEATNRAPLTIFNPIQNNSTTLSPSVFSLAGFQGQQVQWSKSYVQFTNAPTTGGSPKSICIGVYYA